MGRLRNRKSVLIGNGYSDFCTAGAADFVFAKSDLIDHCRAEGIPFYAFSRFEELTPLVSLISGDGSQLLALAQKQAA
jgi:2-hydroxy-3-keto-5-methylthiopentenyl-1-phosphate phosphatase